MRSGPRILFPALRGAIVAVPLWLAACATANPIFDEIRTLEAERRGDARLVELARDADPAVRRAACAALGAVGGHADVLGETLDDPDAGVRYAAAFALARIATPAAAERLRPLAAAEDANLRLCAARGLPASSTAADADLLLDLAQNDPSAPVRGAAALGIGRMFGSREDGAVGVAAMERELATLLAAEREEDVRWRLAWALSRFGAAAGAEVIDPLWAAAGAPRGDPTAPPARWTRVMALRALGRRCPAASDEARRACIVRLVETVGDGDPQVVLAALRGLDAALADGEAAPEGLVPQVVLLRVHRQSPHTQAAAIAVLAEHPPANAVGLLTRTWSWNPRPGPEQELSPFVDHDSRTVRAAALVALARLAPADAIPLVEARLTASDPLERAAAAAAVRFLPNDAAAQLLAQALADDDVRVRTAAVRALAGHGSAPWLGDVLAAAARQPDPAVREAVREAVEQLGPEHAALAPPSEEAATVPHFPRVGADVPFDFLGTRPLLEVRTTKGAFEIALVPAAAPVHCWNFLQLAAAGAYDGTVFHRVVPDFVIQGGSRRGDGHDNDSWLGGPLRDEISPLPFLAGTLGMPKNAEPDTGGGQFFITLVPAPHLDGRYTAFGRITAGLDVAELIEVGDRILAIVPKVRRRA